MSSPQRRLPPVQLPCDPFSGCFAQKLTGADECFAHAGKDDQAAVLERIRQGSPVDVGAGVEFSEELLAELLAALPHDDDDHVVVHKANFYRAKLPGLNLSGARFHGGAQFEGAHFHDRVRFDGVTFRGEARFGQATFHGGASFKAAQFQVGAMFSGATFEGEASFGPLTADDESRSAEVSSQGVTKPTGATFHNEVRFTEAAFEGKADFEKVRFEDVAAFDVSDFQDNAWFTEADFRSEVKFDDVRFQASVFFTRVSFLRARELGPMLVKQGLSLDDALFDQPIAIMAKAATISCRRARFLAGVQFRLRDAAVTLSDADLAAPAALAGVSRSLGEDDSDLAQRLERPPLGHEADTDGRPRLLSVERADVAGLHLVDVDLRACRFVDALNLDRLRIEGVPLLALPPRRWHARRLAIAEEHQWRSERHDAQQGSLRLDQPPGGGWYPSVCQPPGFPVGAPGVVEPARIAAVYRELRKGREDAKDEPGAADFYYGEMEMRRHSPSTAGAERVILTLYWLVSGYGLRGWRALTALAVVIGLVGVGFSQVGVHPPPSLPVSWLYALQATVSLEGKARQLSGQLTLPGELLRVGLRLSGPVLLGLALLSIRNRVKR